MSVGQHVYVIGIKDTEVHTHPVGPGYPEKYVLTILVYDLALVGHGNGKPHGLERQANVIAIHIGKTGTGCEHHFAIDPAGEDPQSFPGILALPWGKGLDDMARLIIFPVEVSLEMPAQGKGKFVVVHGVRDVKTARKRDKLRRFFN